MSERGDQIERGVRGFGEDSEAARGDADNDFSAGDEDGGHHRISGDRALFGAHGIGRIKGRRPGHDGIIAAKRNCAKGISRCAGF